MSTDRTPVSTYPVVHLVVLPGPLGVGHLVVRIVTVHEILHDRAALEEPDGRPVGELVRQRRNSPIGVDLEEPRLLEAGEVGPVRPMNTTQRL